MRCWIVLALLFALARPAPAQESRFASDLRREREHVAENCGDLAIKSLIGCALTLTTDYPFHLALGSLAPQNGMGFGLAFVERYTPNERWRISWNADGVATPSGAWRGGVYMKVIHTGRPDIVVLPAGSQPSGAQAVRPYPVLTVYGQGISLEKQAFFGAGPRSAEEGRSLFSERQTIIGASALIPLTRLPALGPLRASLVGALNVRSVSIRGMTDDQIPAITSLYDDLTAPGLRDQPTFWQFQEGLRLRPSFGADRVRLNYLVDVQQFVAGAGSRSSFHRWTADLKHEIPLYRRVASSWPLDSNGPDDCFSGASATTCPAISYSRNRHGTVSLRVLVTSSAGFSGSRVPFYFQPTLGGSDINGQRLLSSYEDYRFRGTQLIALQGGIEHGIWGPIGFHALAEQGKVGESRRDLNLRGLLGSYSVGLTVRAAGFPVMTLSYAWGSSGNHVISTIDNALLGGSGRPSLQ